MDGIHYIPATVPADFAAGIRWLLILCGMEILEQQNASLPRNGQTDFIQDRAPYQ